MVGGCLLLDSLVMSCRPVLRVRAPKPIHPLSWWTKHDCTRGKYVRVKKLHASTAQSSTAHVLSLQFLTSNPLSQLADMTSRTTARPRGGEGGGIAASVRAKDNCDLSTGADIALWSLPPSRGLSWGPDDDCQPPDALGQRLDQRLDQRRADPVPH